MLSWYQFLKRKENKVKLVIITMFKRCNSATIERIKKYIEVCKSINLITETHLSISRFFFMLYIHSLYTCYQKYKLWTTKTESDMNKDEYLWSQKYVINFFLIYFLSIDRSKLNMFMDGIKIIKKNISSYKILQVYITQRSFIWFMYKMSELNCLQKLSINKTNH